jgi:DNA-binding MarR family transcriptional regulator
MSSPTDDSKTDARALARLLEQASALLSGNVKRSGLHPVQWAALRFAASTDGKRHTIGEFARHQGVTPSPASRTIHTLCRKGLLKVVVDQQDRRRRVLELLEPGARFLDDDPLKPIEEMMGALPADDRDSLRRALEFVLSRIEPGRA